MDDDLQIVLECIIALPPVLFAVIMALLIAKMVKEAVSGDE